MDLQKEYHEIEQYLRDHGLSWITDQVKEEIETGKFIEERITTLHEASAAKSKRDYYESEFKKGQLAEFTRRQDYSDEEKLTLLLEAIKRAVFDVAVMQYETTGFFFDSVQSIVFEEETVEAPRLLLTSNTRTMAKEAREAAVIIDKLIHDVGHK